MGTYAGAEQTMVTAWVKARIAAQTDALELISVGLTQRVFEDFAPQGTTYPFIIVQCQVPPRDVRGVGTSRVMVDTMFIVKGVAQTDSYAPLAPLARIFDDALTVPAGSMQDDGFIFASVREEQHSMVEIESGKQYRHFGGLFKIQAQG